MILNIFRTILGGGAFDVDVPGSGLGYRLPTTKLPAYVCEMSSDIGVGMSAACLGRVKLRHSPSNLKTGSNW